MDGFDHLSCLDLLDAFHLPDTAASRVEMFKEWQHFTVIDQITGWIVTLNLSVQGNPHKVGAGEAHLILLAYHQDHGWSGGVETLDGTAAQISPKRLDFRLGDSWLRYSGGAYEVSARLQAEGLRFDARLTVASEPLMIWNNTPLGSGFINWLVVPRLRVRGTLVSRGETISVDAAVAYHDHNWGFWYWGEDLAWDWGFTTEPELAENHEPLTLVFDRTSDRHGDRIKEQTLALWKGDRIHKVFARTMLHSSRRGVFDREPVRCLPGVMNLLVPGRVCLPSSFSIAANRKGDRLSAEFEVTDAIQVAIPSELGFGVIQLNEAVGSLRVSGEIKGEPVAFRAMAC